MRRDEPGHALPAWLRDQPPAASEPPPARKSFRRVVRPEGAGCEPKSETPETAATAVQAAERPVASVPFGTPLLPPAGAADDAGETPTPEPGAPRSEDMPRSEETEPSVTASEPSPVNASGEDCPDPVVEAEEPWAPHQAGEHDPSALLPHAFEHQPSTVDLASDVLVRRSRRSSPAGWRRGVQRFAKGLLEPGDSTGSARHEHLVERIRQPISGDYRIAVLSLKGGVGKTTTTIGLGSTFASLRGDCVVAVDANPDFGTLAQRIPQQTDATVRDLLAAAPTIRRYSDVRAHTSQAPSRLEVLASERDPAVSEAFSEDDYRAVVDILQVFYNIILTDCGTGIMHSAMRGVLDLANALVLVGSPALDGARSAAATLDWLQAHGYDDLVDRTVVVISAPRPGTSTIDMDALTAHFLARCRALHVVPFDEHLAEGAEIDLERLRPATRRAFVELAAIVADDFPPLSGRHAGRG